MARGMSKDIALTIFCLLSTPALAQTAFKDVPADSSPLLSGRIENGELSRQFPESNPDRRLSDELPGAWQSEKQILNAVQAAETLANGEKDGVMFYATSRRTVVSWKLGGGLEDASLSRTEVTPGQASIGVAYRTGQTSVGLAYVSREYSQRFGAESVSQSEDFAGLTVKMQLGGR